MTGDEFIVLAGKLAAAADEASLGTSVSRAYYGAYHLALAFLNDVGCPVATNSHGEPPRRLMESGNDHAKNAGHFLNELQTARIAADYRFDNHRLANPQFARKHVELAHRVRQEFAKCNGPRARDAMKAEIERVAAKRVPRAD